MQSLTNMLKIYYTYNLSKFFKIMWRINTEIREEKLNPIIEVVDLKVLDSCHIYMDFKKTEMSLYCNVFWRTVFVL